MFVEIGHHRRRCARRAGRRTARLRRDKPDAFSPSSATASIQAPPEKIFPLINDFHRWGAWSPWEKWTPALKRRTHSGAASGKGAVVRVGGQQERSARGAWRSGGFPTSKVIIQLDFFKPFEAHNTASSRWRAGTVPRNVTWPCTAGSPTCEGHVNVISMDKMSARISRPVWPT